MKNGLLLPAGNSVTGKNGMRKAQPVRMARKTILIAGDRG